MHPLRPRPPAERDACENRPRSAARTLPAWILADRCIVSEKGRSGWDRTDRAQFRVKHRCCAADRSCSQLHAARDPAGACASRAVSVHGLACRGCGCGCQRRSGLWLWSGGWGVVEVVGAAAGAKAGAVGWREWVWCDCDGCA